MVLTCNRTFIAIVKEISIHSCKILEISISEILHICVNFRILITILLGVGVFRGWWFRGGGGRERERLQQYMSVRSFHTSTEYMDAETQGNTSARQDNI